MNGGFNGASDNVFIDPIEEEDNGGGFGDPNQPLPPINQALAGNNTNSNISNQQAAAHNRTANKVKQ